MRRLQRDARPPHTHTHQAFQPLRMQGLAGTANAFAAKRMPLTLQPEAHDVFFSSTAANGFITAFYEMM